MSELTQRLIGSGLAYLAAGARFHYERRTKVRRVETVRHLRVARGAATVSSWSWFALLIFSPLPGLVPVGGLPFPAPARSGLQVAGALVLAAAVALFVWCHRALGELWFGEPALKERHQLVQAGPYRWVRHPMYTAFFTGYLGALLLMQSWPFLVPILFAPGFLVMARAEEELLGARFPGYARYRSEAGLFLPRLFR
jgi:protein-S-isoprenylcysteine O-methyltransferase Ste14